jgi:hypothetical protein
MENNSINAYKISAKIEGESWNYLGGTFAASNESEAIEKAKNILKIKDNHVITTEHIRVYPIGTKLQNDNYPYGRERATAYYSIEYVKNKGCRSVFQTINPKNGRINNPKKSTYYRIILPCEIVSNGHFDSVGYLDFNGSDAINKGLVFMSDFYSCFTKPQIEESALVALAMIKIDMRAQVIYKGSDLESLKPLYEPIIKNLVEITKFHENLFANVLLDLDAIKAASNKDFKAFKTI